VYVQNPSRIRKNFALVAWRSGMRCPLVYIMSIDLIRCGHRYIKILYYEVFLYICGCGSIHDSTIRLNHGYINILYIYMRI